MVRWRTVWQRCGRGSRMETAWLHSAGFFVWGVKLTGEIFCIFFFGYIFSSMPNSFCRLLLTLPRRKNVSVSGGAPYLLLCASVPFQGWNFQSLNGITHLERWEYSTSGASWQGYVPWRWPCSTYYINRLYPISRYVALMTQMIEP